MFFIPWPNELIMLNGNVGMEIIRIHGDNKNVAVLGEMVDKKCFMKGRTRMILVLFYYS